jgi:hypothetical protein
LIKFLLNVKEVPKEHDFPFSVISTFKELFENKFDDENLQHQEFLAFIKDKVKYSSLDAYNLRLLI